MKAAEDKIMNGKNHTSKRSRCALPLALALSAICTASLAEEPLPAVDWSGAYSGVMLGLTHSDGQANLGLFSGALLTLDVENGLFPAKIDGERATGLVGLGIGYNVQRGNFLIGLEADFSALDHNQTQYFSRIDPNPDPMFNGLETNSAYKTEFGNLMTLRIRGGYAQGQNLFFATAGLAAGKVRNEFAIDLPGLPYSSPDWSTSGTRHGLIFGVGLERRMTERVSFKAEVMRFDLKDVTIEARDPVVFPGESIDYKFQNSGTLIRLGVNFAF